jgi:hypothetical protein
VSNGDVIDATAIGNVISGYKNGVLSSGERRHLPHWVAGNGHVLGTWNEHRLRTVRFHGDRSVHSCTELIRIFTKKLIAREAPSERDEE